MPTAPPASHLTFPTICGLGKNGAKPRVKHSRITSFQSFINFFILKKPVQIYEQAFLFYCLILIFSSVDP